ncbi:hypothetical protein BH24ACT5_BH24ACT5_22950 [soil metagenome]
MYFDVLERAKQRDLSEADDNLSGEDPRLATEDPVRLRAPFVEWGVANGIEFDDATLDFMTAQAVTAAMSLPAAGPDGYRDIDNRIAEQPDRLGGAVALVSWGAPTTTTG